ncbi:MAG: glutamate synthase [bacterium]|nr:glutamate synthase [bacterium]
MTGNTRTEKLLSSRADLFSGRLEEFIKPRVAEGGCGVVGLAASRAVEGQYLKSACIRMHNRGNGKGGGIAAAGLSAEQMKVPAEVLRDCYMLQIAYLNPDVRGHLEKRYLKDIYDIYQGYACEPEGDYRDISGLTVRPPDVWRYFVRVKKKRLEQFTGKNRLADTDPRTMEDELVYQTSFRINRRYYSSLGEKQAFVLSHGRDLLIFKIVGYAEQVIEYYGLDHCRAHVWIAHQRYPTKGRVWHPGGAHPFIGMNEALVHNGDFANYQAISEYLQQRNYRPLFLTDTEVSVLLFDLYDRIYGYPLEYICEALAPTTERDFLMLPTERKKIYRAIQWAHQHASPDGPWFFILARSQPEQEKTQLIGITDTSMLRPQVFAVQEQLFTNNDRFKIGLIASEKQAIDAVLESLTAADSRICPRADRYWNARGGSYTDGGAFMFTVNGCGENRTVSCSNKFGEDVLFSSKKKYRPWIIDTVSPEKPRNSRHQNDPAAGLIGPSKLGEVSLLDARSPKSVFVSLSTAMKDMDYREIKKVLESICHDARQNDEARVFTIEYLTLLLDRQYDTGKNKAAWVKSLVLETLTRLFSTVPCLSGTQYSGLARVGYATRQSVKTPPMGDSSLFIDAAGFPPEGSESLARFVVACYDHGWRNMVVFGLEGQRFLGCGLGGESTGTRIEVYGSSGDYLGSGLDGAEMVVHGTAQDQLGQILKRGKLVVQGDVGQTFLYGAKGGEIFVMGNAAGRPLINAVGNPRAVINGTCLDYLAESFMAADPQAGGGFVILNGITFNEQGVPVDLDTPYPGGNLFSLASGGAIYFRDPFYRVEENQLNGGSFSTLADEDWALILPYLEENERLFGIGIDDLLTVAGERRQPGDVYRKVSVSAQRPAILI